jgi:hypothetical protein
VTSPNPNDAQPCEEPGGRIGQQLALARAIRDLVDQSDGSTWDETDIEIKDAICARADELADLIVDRDHTQSHDDEDEEAARIGRRVAAWGDVDLSDGYEVSQFIEALGNSSVPEAASIVGANLR